MHVLCSDPPFPPRATVGVVFAVALFVMADVDTIEFSDCGVPNEKDGSRSGFSHVWYADGFSLSDRMRGQSLGVLLPCASAGLGVNLICACLSLLLTSENNIKHWVLY